MTTSPTLALIILTYNAAQDVPAQFAGIAKQTRQPDDILVIDSSSTDNTQTLLRNYPVKLHVIKQKEFNHGSTRQWATTLVKADFYLYLTQDAIPAFPNTFENMLKMLLSDPKIGCVYGNQLPKPDANPLSAHARVCNYPQQSSVKEYADRAQYGIKTCFNSDSFAAYRKEALDLIGGFPTANMSEDMYVAGKMLLKGLKVAYAADACVYHSHNFTVAQEFRRYLAIGKFHQEQPWIREHFSLNSADGFAFVKSELNYLRTNKQMQWIPRALLGTCAKFAGYHLGLHNEKLPKFVRDYLKIG